MQLHPNIWPYWSLSFTSDTWHYWSLSLTVQHLTGRTEWSFSFTYVTWPFLGSQSHIWYVPLIGSQPHSLIRDLTGASASHSNTWLYWSTSLTSNKRPYLCSSLNLIRDINWVRASHSNRWPYWGTILSSYTYPYWGPSLTFQYVTLLESQPHI